MVPSPSQIHRHARKREEAMTTYESIDQANEAIAQKIINAQPRLVDVVPAKTVIPELGGRLILHAGPPIAFKDMPDPVQGAAVGAALFEGWAADEAEARRVCERRWSSLRTITSGPSGRWEGSSPETSPSSWWRTPRTGTVPTPRCTRGRARSCASASTTSPSVTIWSGCVTFSAPACQRH